MLEHIGFPWRWREWISTMLRTATTRVVTNSRAGRRICHARGLRQGDPLSPLLFVIVMEVLIALITEADQQGLLTPLLGGISKHRASVYADDLVILLVPTSIDCAYIRQLLELFAGASGPGLGTNVDKCPVTPIAYSVADIAAVPQVFPCRLQPFPTKYPAMLLCPGKLRQQDEQGIVDVVAARILTWKVGLLNSAGCAMLSKSTSPSAMRCPHGPSPPLTSVIEHFFGKGLPQ